MATLSSVVGFLLVTLTKLVLLAVVCYIALFGVYGSYPEWFGHREFYVRCKKLQPGMTLEQARLQMAAFLEVGRTWPPPDDTLHAGLMTASAVDVPETAAEHGSRIIFIPDAKNFADWCIVYPQADVVARVEISPD